MAFSWFTFLQIWPLLYWDWRTIKPLNFVTVIKFLLKEVWVLVLQGLGIILSICMVAGGLKH